MTDKTKERARNVLDFLRLSQMWPAQMHERLERWARAKGINKSAAILVIVAERLEKDGVQ